MRPSVTANRPWPLAPLVNVGASGGGPASVPCSSSVPEGRGRPFGAGSSASSRPRASSWAVSPAPFPSLVRCAVPSTVPPSVSSVADSRSRTGGLACSFAVICFTASEPKAPGPARSEPW